jgi:putative transposase
MLKLDQVRLYPTKEQEESLAKAFGCTRWLWNNFLAQNNEVYKETGRGLSRFDYQKQLPQLKKEFDWLAETYSQCLQVVCLNLNRAFTNFFECRARDPRFKSKHGRQSVIYPQNVNIQGEFLKSPKLGNIYTKFAKEIDDRLQTVTVSQNPDGKYYASLLFDDGKDKPRVSSEGKAIGID